MLLQMYNCLAMPGKPKGVPLASCILKQLVTVTLQREMSGDAGTTAMC